MQATITNRVTTFAGPPDWLAELKTFFCYTAPGSQFSPRFRMGAWDGKTHMLKWGKVGTGLFLFKQEELQKAFPQMKIVDQRMPLGQRPFPTGAPKENAQKAHPWQLECVESMLSKGNGLVLCATGSGKTFMAGLFLSRVEGTACFCVDELTLLDQARQELEKVTGENIGTVGMGVFAPQRITVATVQTLNKQNRKPEFKKWFEGLQVIIVDEIHVALNRRSIEIVRTAKPVSVFGLTATLEIDKDHVAFPAMALAGNVVYSYSLTQGQADKILSTGRAVLVRYIHRKPLSSNPETRYNESIIHNEERNQVICDIALEGVRRGHRVVVLAKRLRHLDRLDRMFSDAGQKHATLSGADDQSLRRGAIRQMERGKVPLILASTIFTKGVNIKTADVLINTTADSSANSTQQRVGRIARVADDKDDFLYIDIADGAPFGKTNPFAKASAARKRALEALGMAPPIIRWEGNASAIYDYQPNLDF